MFTQSYRVFHAVGGQPHKGLKRPDLILPSFQVARALSDDVGLNPAA
jgi:hypothetical protein